MKVPRRRDVPDDNTVARLQRAAEARTQADAELRAAVRAASDAGGSVRVIAELAGISTRTVQNWLADRTK